MDSIFTGEQGVAYIPMPKGRGFTPRLVIPDVPRVHRQQCLPQRLQMGLRDEYFQLAIGPAVELIPRRDLLYPPTIFSQK